MTINKRKIVFLIILILFSSTAVFAADGGRLAVFPYYAMEGALSEEYNYALFMVPDMIKIKLMESERFYMIEPYELEAAAVELQYEEDYYRYEEKCLKTAGSLDIDYYIRGYLYTDKKQLMVVHTVVSVADGKVIHIEKQKLPDGRELLELLEKSSDIFAEWVNKKLPDPEVPVVVIERETVVEHEEERTQFGLSVGAARHYYLFGSAQYLEPNLSFNLGFLFQAPDWDYTQVGFRVLFELLNQKQAFYEISNQEIDVLLVPILLSGRTSVPLFSFMSLEGGIDLGGALVFGFVEPDIIASFRPSVAADAGVLFFPDSMVSVGISCGMTATFFAYEQIHLYTVSPSLVINFNF